MDGKSVGYDPRDVECPGDSRLECPGFVEVSGAQSEAPLCARCQFRHNFLEGRDPLSVALVEEQTAHRRTAAIANAALRRLKQLADFGAKSKPHLDEGRTEAHKRKSETAKQMQDCIDSYNGSTGIVDSRTTKRGKFRRMRRQESKRVAIIHKIQRECPHSSYSNILKLENANEIYFPDDAKKRHRQN